jgi:hypothetical protein
MVSFSSCSISSCKKGIEWMKFEKRYNALLDCKIANQFVLGPNKYEKYSQLDTKCGLF